MPAAVVKLVAVLLLMVQGAIGLAPWRVICIPAPSCGTDEPEMVVGCGHCDSADDTDMAGRTDGRRHGHGPFSLVLHAGDECGHHDHLPVPGDEQVPTNPRSGKTELKTLVAPLCFAFAVNWDRVPPRAVAERAHPPDFRAADQIRVLRTTRLLI